MSSTIQKSAEFVILGKKTNVLLVRDEIGRAKPTTRNLPDDSFAFGKHDMLPGRETVYQGKLSFTDQIT